MKKKGMIVIFILILIIVGIFFMLTGEKRTDVVLQDFSISEDGTKMTLQTMLSSSMGYIRKMKEKQDGDNLYLTFYSTYGINSKIGAKNSFELKINPSCEEIYFDKGQDGYQIVLQKNKTTNVWEKVQ